MLNKILKLMGLSLILCFISNIYAEETSNNQLQKNIADCQSGEVVACEQVAWVLGMDDNMQDQSVYYYEIACDAGSGSACSALGVLYQYGEGVEQNIQHAEHYYQQGCIFKEETACYSLGEMFSEGSSAKKDIDQASLYLQQACELSSLSDGCLSSAKLQLATGNEEARTKAVSTLKKSCSAGEVNSCDYLGRVLWKSDAVADISSASNLVTASTCHDENCYKKVNQEKNIAVSDEQSVAIEYLDKACGLGLVSSCQYLLSYYQGLDSNLGNRKKVRWYQDKIRLL